MQINEAIEYVKQGKLLKLPNFEGYFKWDYSTNSLMFKNKDYKCKACTLPICDRNDFYYIT